MRIVAGRYRGRQLSTIDSNTCRPTTDRVREAMFSSIISIYGDIYGCIVLDAFGGSGALGLEAISRGAKQCIAFERDKKIYNNLIKNYESLSIDKRNVYNLDISKVNFQNLFKENSFDLIFFDPPYKTDVEQVFDILNKLKDSNCISEGAVLVYEHDIDNKCSCLKNLGFMHNKDKIYGDTVLTYFIYKRGSDE